MSMSIKSSLHWFHFFFVLTIYHINIIGLGIVYLINTILAILAVFKAQERGQPTGLWAIKTFSVGGLALDQLTQLPTLAQVKEMESRKGARAIKKKKK